MSEKKTLTTSQIAEMCGVTSRTVNRWVRAGYFPSAQRAPGRTSPYRIPKDEVETFIAQMSARVKRHYKSRLISQLEAELDHPDQQGVLAALAETLRQFEEQQEQKRVLFALIVEDDPDAGDIFEFALRTAGFTPAVVKSGKTALGWLASMVPDILILDLHLPDIPGIEVLRHMQADPRLADVPVIVATAHPELAERIEDQANLVLIKPVRYNVLQDQAVELAQGE